MSLLLVGPRFFVTEAEDRAFDELIARDGVVWVDHVPREQIGQYLNAMTVGLTPYRDSMFNRRSYPLKTVEYLAAGIPVVATDVAITTGLDPRFVRVASDHEAFAAAVRDVIDEEWDAAAIAASMAAHGWDSRARDLLTIITNDGATS